MWKIKELEKDSNHVKFELEEDGKAISNEQFLEFLAEEQAFVRWYNQLLAECRFEAFFWENKPIASNNLDKGYECNLVKSDILARVSADAQTFRSYFQNDQNAVTFSNIGGDAQLVAPCPVINHSAYPQIGDFVRKAPHDQILDFWQLVGKKMQNHITNEPRWLSTSGLGVYWLHVRIDSYPKYYQTEEYRSAEC